MEPKKKENKKNLFACKSTIDKFNVDHASAEI